MDRARRQTRSCSSGRPPQKEDTNSAAQMKAKQKIKKAIKGGKYEQAMLMIKSIPDQTHWLNCQRARILFQLGQIESCYKVIRRLLNGEQNECYSCLQIFTQILQRQNPQITQYQRLIKSCLQSESIPLKLKSELEFYLDKISNYLEMRSAGSLHFMGLVKHYRDRGVDFQKVAIEKVSPEYRVTTAKEAIQPFEVIIAVPEDEIITLERAKKLPEVARLADQDFRLKSPKHCMLSVFLVIQRQLRKESLYYNYIRCLPRNLETFPINYSKAELDQLQGTSFLATLLKKKRQIKEDYQEIMEILPRLTMTEEEFVWARMVTSSRIFGIIVNEKKTDALVPIADMLNHRIPKMTSWYFCDSRRAFVVQNSGQKIEKGQQIFDSYGSKCNSRFLLNYGFAVEDNIYNQVTVGLKKFRSSKTAPNIRISTNLNTDEFRMLLSYYRYFASHSTDNQESETQSNKSKKSQFISEDNECEVWRLILELVRDRLEQYKTSVAQDQRILTKKSSTLSPNVRNCIIMRMGQKIILEFYERMAQEMIDYFGKGIKLRDQEWYQAYLKQINHYSFY